MNPPIPAIFENGVFRPLHAVDLPEHQPVRLTVTTEPDERDQPREGVPADPLAGVRIETGISDLVERFDDYRFAPKHL